MRVVLQDRDSHLYFRLPDEWTHEADRATDFGKMMKALEAARPINQVRLDIVLLFGDEREYDIRLPASP
jgi:hypothetical protein